MIWVAPIKSSAQIKGEVILEAYNSRKIKLSTARI
jgi:hypothetical protein